MAKKKKENVFKRLANWLNGPEDENPEVADMEEEFTEPLEQEDFEREDVEDAEYTQVEKKTKVQKLSEKLDKILEKLKDKDKFKALSPFQRRLLLVKFDIIKGALDAQRAKIEYKEKIAEKDKFLEEQDEKWNEKIGPIREYYGSQLRNLNGQIYELEARANSLRGAEERTNKDLAAMGLLKPGERYQPKVEDELNNKISDISKKILALNKKINSIREEGAEKQLSEADDFELEEKTKLGELETAIVTAKQNKSFWHRFKEGVKSTANNVKGFFEDTAKEREAKKEQKRIEKEKIKAAKETAKANVRQAVEDNREEETTKAYKERESFNDYVKVAPEKLTPRPDRSEESAEEKAPSLREQLAERYKGRRFDNRPKYYENVVEANMNAFEANSIEELYNLLPEIEKEFKGNQEIVEEFIAGYYATHPEQGKDGQSQDDDGPEL